MSAKHQAKTPHNQVKRLDPEVAAQVRGRARALQGRNPELLIRLAREQTQSALETLVKLMGDLEQPGSVRVRCAELILERGWGKTPQQIVLSDPDGVVGMAAIPILERIAAIKAAHSGGETIELESSELLELESPRTEKLVGEDSI